MKTAEYQILTRIGFAERWLQRAREECLGGNVARGLLTLVLADGEMRRLLQLSGAPIPRSHNPRARTVFSATASVHRARERAGSLETISYFVLPVDSSFAVQ